MKVPLFSLLICLVFCSCKKKDTDLDSTTTETITIVTEEFVPDNMSSVGFLTDEGGKLLAYGLLENTDTKIINYIPLAGAGKINFNYIVFNTNTAPSNFYYIYTYTDISNSQVFYKR